MLAQWDLEASLSLPVASPSNCVCSLLTHHCLFLSLIKNKNKNKRTVPVLSGGSALCVHAVHRHRCLQVVRMRVQRVVVRVRVPVGVELVAEQCRRLRGSVQVQVVIVVANVNAGRKRVVVSRRILTVLLRAHGAVAWTQKDVQRMALFHNPFPQNYWAILKS